MSRYRVTFPFIPSMGSVCDMVVRRTPMMSERRDALWHLNSMRRHDGLPEWRRLPAGCVFTPLPEATP